MKGWEIKSLRDVVSIDKVQGNHVGLPYVGLENIESETAKFNGSLEPQAVKSMTFKFGPEHILYRRLRPYLNKVLMPDFSGHCSTEIFPIKPSSNIDRRFLLYWLLSDTTVARINDTCTGARMPRANMDHVLDFDFPMPPLAEQRRIVAILDDAFAGLETLRANAERCRENIDELYQTQLDGIFNNHSWSRKSLSEIAQINYGYTEKAQIKPVGPKFLRITDIQDGRVDWEQVPYCQISDADKNQFSLRSGDIVFARTGATTGKSYLLNDPPQSVCASYLIRLRVVDENVVPDFVFHFFKTGIYWRKISAGITGSAQGGFNASKLGEMAIYLPPKGTQQVVIKKLNEVNNYYSILKRAYANKIATIDELKQSLLHRAFSGQLTAAETAAA